MPFGSDRIFVMQWSTILKQQLLLSQFVFCTGKKLTGAQSVEIPEHFDICNEASKFLRSFFS